MAKSPANSSAPPVLFWFRRDLRTSDNAGLYHALKHGVATGAPVYCVFVFDRTILDKLPRRQDRRVEFILACVAELKDALRASGGDLIICHAQAVDEIPRLAATLGASHVFTNHDYEPDAILRDDAVRDQLRTLGIAFQTYKDTVIFEKDEVLTQAGKPFSVFTPYKNAWLKTLNDFYLKPYPVARHAKALARPSLAPEATAVPTLASLGFEATNIKSLMACGVSGAQKRLADFVARIAHYKDARDYPALKGVSYLSMDNRFGTVSIRELAALAHAETMKRSNPGAETWLSELIWRDFYFQIIWHAPHAAKRAFRPEYDALVWENDSALFKAWCEARTGYPIIDAAMRQINETGYMHNRLRMIVASFLTKDLLIDWRQGEQYFADHLNDFDLSANNGGWQWAASTGCDAQPYFRIFNPVTQSERFDPEGKFIRRYLPELAALPDKFIHAPWTMPPLEAAARNFVPGRDYPLPVVEHAVQRDRALLMYKKVKAAENAD